MTLTEAISVIAELGEHFDSHDFIKDFIFKYPSTYGTMLIKYKSVTRTHAEIANFLRLNSTSLSILRVDDMNHKSCDIFGNLAPCAKWTKVK